ncbi:MAG: hypothetical protein IV100_17740 [Myxococcales bacterium]|nr:hypothetical protein [Myxococcales bacterium]
MTREHLIHNILSAVFPSGSIPLAFLDRVPRLQLLAGALADEVGPDVPPGAPVSPSAPTIVVAKHETPAASAPQAAQVRSKPGVVEPDSIPANPKGRGGLV